MKIKMLQSYEFAKGVTSVIRACKMDAKRYGYFSNFVKAIEYVFGDFQTFLYVVLLAFIALIFLDIYNSK